MYIMLKDHVKKLIVSLYNNRLIWLINKTGSNYDQEKCKAMGKPIPCECWESEVYLMLEIPPRRKNFEYYCCSKYELGHLTKKLSLDCTCGKDSKAWKENLFIWKTLTLSLLKFNMLSCENDFPSKKIILLFYSSANEIKLLNLLIKLNQKYY